MGNFIKQFFDIKFWKFILVGILNTVVGMGLQFLFFNLCGWNEWVSSLIGYILGSILSYFLNKYFTFKNKDKGWKPIVKFALNIAICYGLAYGIAIPLISMLCTANSWTMFGWSVEKFAGNFSMIVGACLFVAFNYIGSNSYEFMVPYLVMALIYIVMVLLISLGIKLMERSLKKSDRRN